MSDLISVPLKKPSEVDIIKPLKNLIQSRYSTADNPEDYSDQISELSKLRNNAIWRAFEKYESSLEIVYGYYDQLVALESKIPAQEVQIPFKWKDAFDKGSIFGSRISLTIASLAYEKVCILFNIAALQSAVASNQSIDSDEGLKLAAKLFQQAAGIYSHLKSIVVVAIQQDPTPDLNPDTLGALSALMLAQAQEIFVQKSIHDKMKDQIIAKLAGYCEDLYADCLKQFQKESLKPLWEKEWLSIIAGKQAGYHAVAEFYQSLVCKNNKAIGEEIARLTQAVELFKAAQSRSGNAAMFQELANKAQRNLNEAKKDNDFIYHERIPDVNSLEPIGRAQLAKALLISNPMSQNFKDLFSELVPVSVHQALAAYDVRKNEIQNVEISKLRESTQLLNSVLASLNLPAAIESTEGNQLPPSILEKATAVRQLGGISTLQNLIAELPELFKRNREILDEAERMLNEEKQADDSLRTQFKEKWARTPSDKLTEMFRSNAAKYRQIINNAIEADKSVKERFEAHKNGMELLSKSPEELQNAVPKNAGCGGVSECSSVTTLRKLMEEVETLKAERDVIESELKSATIDMKDKFLQALAIDGCINEPVLSLENIGQIFGPLQKQVKESIAKQEELISRIQTAHGDFARESGSGASGRENVLSQLAAAHDAFRELQNNLQEGTKFYNDLTQLLVVFQNKISDYCFARKTEKEELLKDLTQETSRSVPPPAPSTPAYYGGAKKDEPTPSASSAPQPNLPYPVYVSGMPIPYGAPPSTPYPSYAPPPLPSGYNPYGTMPPYPGNAYYPPGYPQQGQQGPPGPQNYQGPNNYPQQQPPPGNYQNPW